MVKKQIDVNKNSLKENFNPSLITNELKETVVKIVQLKALKNLLEEIEYTCGKKVLEENIIYGYELQKYESGNIVRDEDTNEPCYKTIRVLNPNQENEIYRYKEEEFGKYLQLQTKELEENGIYKKSYDLGASLIVSIMILELERDFIKQLEPLTGIKNNQLSIIENRKKFLTLSETLVVSTMDDNYLDAMKKTLLIAEPVLELDKKIRIDTDLKRNDALMDFSQSISNLLIPTPQEEVLKKIVTDFDKKEIGKSDINKVILPLYIYK